MSEFDGVLRRRIWFLAHGVGFAVLAVLVSVAYQMTRNGVAGNMVISLDGFASGFRTGIFVVFVASMMNSIMRAARALRSEDALRRLYIQESDERTNLIRDRVGRAGLDFITGGLATASFIAGMFNETVFYTLCGALAFAVLVKASLKFYYSRRF